MEENFELPVPYKGQENCFQATLVVTGYTYQIIVDVGGQNIIFEPDEERNYRAVIPYLDIANRKSVDVGLLQSIAAAIENIGR